MIILYAGNIGSSKTLNAVRDMVMHPKRTYYTNIETYGLKNVRRLNASMIVKKEPTGAVSKGQPVYERKLNKEFWVNIEKPVSVILDETGNIFGARSAMSKNNQIGMQWLSLIRKMIGEDSKGYSDVIFISQRSGGVDNIIRDMCHQVKYFICFYSKRCRDCGYSWREHSDMPYQRQECKRCKSEDIEKFNFKTRMLFFASPEAFKAWKLMGYGRPFLSRNINGLEKYFKYFNTLQIDDLFSDF